MTEIFIYSVLLAFALSGNLLFLAIGAGVVMHPYSALMNLKAALVFSLAQLLMAGLALFMGGFIAGLIPAYSFQAGTTIIAFVGLKLILGANRIKNENRTFFIEDDKILFGVSLAASFNTLLAYTGFGLILTTYSVSPALVLAVIAFLTVFMGIFVGNKYRPERLGRFSKYLGGIILLILSVYLLLQ